VNAPALSRNFYEGGIVKAKQAELEGRPPGGSRRGKKKNSQEGDEGGTAARRKMAPPCFLNGQVGFRIRQKIVAIVQQNLRFSASNALATAGTRRQPAKVIQRFRICQQALGPIRQASIGSGIIALLQPPRG